MTHEHDIEESYVSVYVRVSTQRTWKYSSLTLRETEATFYFPNIIFSRDILVQPRVNALLVVLPFQLSWGLIRAVRKIRTNGSRIRNKLISVLENFSVERLKFPKHNTNLRNQTETFSGFETKNSISSRQEHI